MLRPLRTRSGHVVSRFAFGTMQFGGRADAAQSHAMFDAARAAGITHFDTAYLYTDGASETLLGEMIAKDAEDLFIATKVAYAGGMGADNIRTQFDVCRQRLKQDIVDLLYLHRFDPSSDLAEAMACLAELKQAGQIRHVGLSNAAAWQVMKTVAVAQTFDLTIDVLQPMYNLVKRQAEVEILPMCADQGITVAPYSPLGGGLLTGKYAQGGSGRLDEDAGYATRYGLDWMPGAVAGLVQIAQELEVNPATLAVAWVAANPNALCPIISARTADQLRPSLDAIDYPLSAEVYARLSALAPTPQPATDRTEELS
ncbi:aldo/keto reductase [Falsiruegeria mediterranea]|uniref:L-glyceraldehyde 3-phosphate reductase n=1 Tax=Falsiruegeria mediterranea M17 TaxID=1200281 RepID=A0A2R8C792_9RHOB|nr:aldo/keto reductase [Falsiruegeria mediterranea]SPJ28272.1 L-glyceraldehyde 3-phosphate reductase [Falsiruegeria mediterranea M17]